MKNILVIFTGGTIGSVADKENVVNIYDENVDNVENYILIRNFRSRNQKNDVLFNHIKAFDILSENMIISKWNDLIEKLQKIENNISDYNGIIITHGTDTLAYTASLIGILLSHIKIPVVFISSDYSPNETLANGNKNFEDAVNFITDIKTPGVYSIYSYDNENSIVYYATRLMQSQTFVDRYDSIGGVDYGLFNNGKFRYNKVKNNVNYDGAPKENLLSKMIGRKIEGNVLIINPYVGLNYDIFNYSIIKSIIHSCYHSFSFCMVSDGISRNSIEELDKICIEKKIDLYISPFDKKIITEKNARIYDSTAKFIKSTNGVLVPNSTMEVTYAKVLIANVLFDDKLSRVKFVNKNINFEQF